jgi:nitrate reductase NapE component
VPGQEILLVEVSAMNSNGKSKSGKSLYTLAMVNAGIWALALVALVILLGGHGNLKGMYVILAGGLAVGIQLIALASRLD